MFLRGMKLFTALCALGLSACSIHGLQHDEIASTNSPREGAITVDRYAQGFSSERVGWGRFTLFYIPVVGVDIEGDESRQLMDTIHTALQAAGYHTKVRGTRDSKQLPIIKAYVEDVGFNNYTWFAPLVVPTWGGLEVTLVLESPTGDKLWAETFSGSGFTLNYIDGYNIAARESMTELVNAMVSAFGSTDFYAALNTTPDSENYLALQRRLAAPKPLGKYQFKVEQMSMRAGCGRDIALVHQIYKEETYIAEGCPDSKSLKVFCDWGVCRADIVTDLSEVAAH
ncbi:hypothetical protein R50073_39480 [Maricurvus nonylphenolicus]|uniref:hypothetical protein n=1 Tax=Maricurvus nonylphenolicus TaxID=1008307 RepID=UPI0036F25D0F